MVAYFKSSEDHILRSYKRAKRDIELEKAESEKSGKPRQKRSSRKVWPNISKYALSVACIKWELHDVSFKIKFALYFINRGRRTTKIDQRSNTTILRETLVLEEMEAGQAVQMWETIMVEGTGLRDARCGFFVSAFETLIGRIGLLLLMDMKLFIVMENVPSHLTHTWMQQIMLLFKHFHI